MKKTVMRAHGQRLVAVATLAVFAGATSAWAGAAEGKAAYEKQCKVCHSELGFRMRAGANDVRMSDIIDGKFCGMCHNNNIAWGAERCDLCHSGRRGLKSGIFGGHETTGPGRW